MANREVDETTGIATTGHEWDGIRELDNPMPRWWLWTFYATIVFAIGYVLWYPAIPLIDGATQGISGVTNRLLLKQEVAAVDSSRKDIMSALASKDLEAISKDEELTRFASAGGGSLFKVHCSQCHGSGAQGGPGYPNLNDDDWIWGGHLDAIYATIKHGVRAGDDDDSRDSQMPAFGADELLERDQINAVTEYVLSISNQEHDADLATKGAAAFEEQCSSCHGKDGKGGREFGAPNLADAISLYGHKRDTVRRQVTKPRHGVMPAWGQRLTDTEVKQLTLYVHGRGGGEAKPEE